MNKFICILLFCIQANALMAQGNTFVITGKVVDQATGLPLQAASVFAQNTSIGTSTDADGNFKIYLPAGGYELAVTFTGYQTVAKRFTSSEPPTTAVSFELQQQEKELKSVVVQSSNEVTDGWQQYGQFFLDNFIGKTANASACSIVNPSVIHFYFYKKRNRLKVKATEPVQVLNKAMGYKISYVLDSFVFEYNTQVAIYTGAPLFEPLTAENEAQAALWKTNRLKAYQGSLLHFMRSLYKRNVKEQGFDVQLIASNQNRDTAIRVKDVYGALQYSKDDSTHLVSVAPNQPDVAVLFLNESPDDNYLKETNDKITRYQVSVLNFSGDRFIEIEQNGYFFDQNDVLVTGYLSWEKVADQLPYDYYPD